MVEDEHLAALYDAIATCQTQEEVARFMRDLCTRQEIGTFAERWWIAQLLADTKLSYRDISARTGASTTTIGRVARFLQQEPHHGYRLALGRRETDADGVSRETKRTRITRRKKPANA
jgi:TrpR-related protein YerC/YecD